MVVFYVEELLKKQKKSKYWLCQKMNITNRNLNRLIHGETSSVSFKYLTDFCKYLNCSLSELIDLSTEDDEVFIDNDII